MHINCWSWGQKRGVLVVGRKRIGQFLRCAIFPASPPEFGSIAARRSLSLRRRRRRSNKHSLFSPSSLFSLAGSRRRFPNAAFAARFFRWIFFFGHKKIVQEPQRYSFPFSRGFHYQSGLFQRPPTERLAPPPFVARLHG